VFRSKVEKSLESVVKVLDTTKHPVRADNAPHQYADKYSLVEHGVRNTVAAAFVGLEALGLDDKAVDKLLAWSLAKKSVSLRLASEEMCVFVKKATREVESDKRSTEYEASSGGVTAWVEKITRKNVTTITEWFWTVRRNER
jgi:hypothetical protein